MKQSTVLKSPEEAIKGISDAYGNLDLKGLSDAEIVKMSVMTSSEELTEGIKFLELLKNLPGAKAEELNLLKTDLFSIFKHKIALTKKAYGINGNIATIVPNPQLNLNLEDVQEVNESEEEKIEPEEQMAKTEVKDNVIKHDFNKKNKNVETKVINKDVERVKNQKKNLTIEQTAPNGKSTIVTPNSTTHGDKSEVSTSFAYFQGYNRKKIFGTSEELPKGVQELILVADTESKIDEIATMLVLENRVEDALNLSVDLFTEKKLKERAEVEKRFLFEVLPFIKQVKVTEPADKEFQKLSLPLWLQYIEDVKDLEKTINEVSSKIAEEVKDKGYISLKSQSVINAYSIELSLEEKLISKIAESAGKKVEDLEWEAYNESDVDMLTKANKKSIIVAEKSTETPAETTTSTVGLTFETLKSECFSKFKANEKFEEIKKFFEAEINNVVDEGFDKTDPQLLTKITAEFFNNKTTVDKAEEAAYEGKDEIPAEVKTEAKNIVKATIEAGGYIVNELRKFFSQKAYRNILGKKKIEEFAKELETEVKTENPELKTRERVRIMMPIAIETAMPDVWQSAVLCKTFEEFKDLLINIVFEKKQITMIVKDKPKSIDGWHVAGNLMEQYGSNYEETKEWNSEKKSAFFNGIINATTEERKKAKESQKTEVAEATTETTTETTTEEIVETTDQKTVVVEEVVNGTVTKQRVEETTTVDMKKFDAIGTLSNTNKIHELMAEFLLLNDYKTYQDRFNELRDNYLLRNKKWSGTKPADRENTINKVVKNNPKIQELVK